MHFSWETGHYRTIPSVRARCLPLHPFPPVKLFFLLLFLSVFSICFMSLNLIILPSPFIKRSSWFLHDVCLRAALLCTCLSTPFSIHSVASVSSPAAARYTVTFHLMHCKHFTNLSFQFWTHKKTMFISCFTVIYWFSLKI